MSRKRSLLISLLARTLIVLLFLLFSVAIISGASGYRFNRQTYQFEETGIINFTIRQNPVTLLLNDKKRIVNKTDVNLSYLVPGQYSIEIEKPNHYTWTKTFYLAPGEVIINPFITLFLENPVVQAATPDQIAILQNTSPPNPPPTDLDVRGREVWVKQLERVYPLPAVSDRYELVGRFVTPVLSAQWLESRNRIGTHVIFQVGDEIRVIERDGTNDFLLAKLSTDNESSFMVIDDGRTLIYRDGEQVFQRPLQ